MFNKDRLAQYLKENSMSINEFARRIYVTPRFVHCLLMGTKNPSIGNVKVIAKEIGCSTDELIL